MNTLARSSRDLSCLAKRLFFACALFPAVAWAQSSGIEPGIAQARTPGFVSRVDVRNEFRQLQSGGSVDLIVPRLDYAIADDLGLRLELPVVTSDPDAPGHGRETGFGDMVARGSMRIAKGAGWSLVAGTELTLDTATRDSLGDGKIVIAPLVFASLDLPQYDSVFFPSLQYYFSLGGNDARPDVRYTSLKPVLFTRWRDGVYTIVEPNFIVDHARADRIGLTLEAEVGRFLNRSLAIWGRPGIGIHGDNLPEVYNWNLQVGVRFFLD
jgi:hypothetical protein